MVTLQFATMLSTQPNPVLDLSSLVDLAHALPNLGNEGDKGELLRQTNGAIARLAYFS